MVKIGKSVCQEVEFKVQYEKKTRYTLLSDLIEEKVKDLRGKVGTMEARDRAEAAGSDGEMSRGRGSFGRSGRESILDDGMTPYQKHMAVSRL